MMKQYFALVPFILIGIAHADGFEWPVSLAAAKAPGSTNLWDLPASLSYLRSAGDQTSYSINAALAVKTPVIFGQTGQAKIEPWVAKNTLIAKKQDKYGIDVGVGAVYNLSGWILFPMGTVGYARDKVEGTEESVIQGTLDLGYEPWYLGGCGGGGGVLGCTYWDLQVGMYNQGVRARDEEPGNGHATGLSGLVQITSNPFAESSTLGPLMLSASAQLLSEIHVTQDRDKDHYPLYQAKIAWKFYKQGDKAKPALALQRVYGEDPIQGMSKQGYTKLSFTLAF